MSKLIRFNFICLLALHLISCNIFSPASFRTNSESLDPTPQKKMFVPPYRLMMPSDHTASFTTSMNDTNQAIFEVKFIKGVPKGKVIEILTLENDLSPEDVSVSVTSREMVFSGELLLGVCLLRSVVPLNQSADAYATFQLVDAENNTLLTKKKVCAETTWRKFQFYFRAEKYFGSKSLRLDLLCGKQKQAIQVGGIQIYNFGTLYETSSLPVTTQTYPERSPNAAWRQTAYQRIQTNRMGTLTLQVVDRHKQEIPGAEILVYMQRHNFHFGTSVSKGLLALQEMPGKKQYAETISTLFNTVTLENGTRWYQWGNSNAAFLKEDAIDAISWAQEKNMSIRGGTLICPNWNAYNPPGIKKLKKIVFRNELRSHIKDITGTLKGKVYSWDVIERPRTCNEFMSVLGNKAPMEWILLTHQTDPAAQIYVGEAGILNGPMSNLDTLEKTIKQYKDFKAKIHGLALEFHINKENLQAPSEIKKRLDRLSKMGLDIEISAIDISLEDEQCQADYLRDVYTMFYSHPAVKGVTYWGFWEGRTTTPLSALIRKDWTLKPAVESYRKLVFDEWWTRYGGRCDNNGRFAFRGFGGNYEIVVKYKGIEKHQLINIKSGSNSKITVALSEEVQANQKIQNRTQINIEEKSNKRKRIFLDDVNRPIIY